VFLEEDGGDEIPILNAPIFIWFNTECTTFYFFWDKLWWMFQILCIGTLIFIHYMCLPTSVL